MIVLVSSDANNSGPWVYGPFKTPEDAHGKALELARAYMEHAKTTWQIECQLHDTPDYVACEHGSGPILWYRVCHVQQPPQ